jgi:hypothetical protein
MEREADNPSPFSVETKTVWSYKSTLFTLIRPRFFTFNLSVKEDHIYFYRF